MLEVKLDNHPTTRMFPRTLEEAYPKDYVNNFFEGPFYSAPHISEYSVLLALIAVFSMLGYVMWRWIC
jgi:hypothetical protein